MATLKPLKQNPTDRPRIVNRKPLEQHLTPRKNPQALKTLSKHVKKQVGG